MQNTKCKMQWYLNYYGSGGIPVVDAKHQSLKRDWWDWVPSPELLWFWRHPSGWCQASKSQKRLMGLIAFTWTTMVLEASQWMMMSRDLKTDQTYVLLHRSLRRDWWDWEIRFGRKVPTALSLVEKSKKAIDWPISTNQGPSNINQSEIFMQPIRDFHTPFDQSESSRNFPSKPNFSLPSVSSETPMQQDICLICLQISAHHHPLWCLKNLSG